MPPAAPPLPPPKKPNPPPPNSPRSNGTAPTSSKTFSVRSGIKTGAQKVVLYGPGGVGKSELASLIAKVGIKPLFLDVGKGTEFLDVERIDNIDSWDDLRSCLHNDELLAPYGAVVIDDMTKAEELDSAWVVRNIPHEKAKPINCIEDYGFGKGFGHIFDQMLLLLQDLDAVARKGKWVIVIAHDCISEFPNPNGDNYIRFEPRLQNPASGKNSVRLRIKEWADHLIFVGYDVFSKDGKAQGSGTRTIYPLEQGMCLAKTRTLSGPISYERGSDELWKQLLNGVQ